MRKSKQDHKKPATARTVVTVKIDGKRWRRVLTLSRSGPTERHFVLETDHAGCTTVRFGDGVHGASASCAARVDVTVKTDEDPIQISLRRSAVTPTEDQTLWVTIRNRTNAIAFSG